MSSMFAEITHPFISRLFAKNLRNLNEIDLAFSPQQNFFIGPNGQGKTNCLEAISLACSLTPMQSLRISDLIMFEKNQAKILASFTADVNTEVEIDILAQGKRARLNDSPVKNKNELNSSYPLVTFIPEELTMISGSSSLRRRALDQACAGMFHEALVSLKAYEKILTHRSQLLKRYPLDRSQLETFSLMLIREGAKLIHYRLKTISLLKDILREKYREIMGVRDLCTVHYSMNDEELKNHTSSDIALLLDERKTLVEALEIQRKTTMFGPHLDDISFKINGVCTRRSASRGQSRAIVLAWKLAHMNALFNIRNASPIIILDDIVSELDAHKKNNLIMAIESLDAQSFLSATDVETFGGLRDPRHTFQVLGGNVSSI